MSGKESLNCSFCGASQKEVKKLIAGPKVYICNQLINPIMNNSRGKNVR